MAPTQVIEHNAHAAEVSSLSRVKGKLRGKSRGELLKTYAGLKLIKSQLTKKRADEATPGAKKSVKDAALKKPADEKLGSVNFMFLLDEAIAKDQISMSQQELIDAKTTELDTTQELAIYNKWYGAGGILKNDAQWVQFLASKAGKAWLKKNEKGVKQSVAIQEAMKKYTVDSAKAQGASSQEDATVQSSQGQTSSDASNLQMKAQMLQAINQLQNAIASLLQQLPTG